MCTHQMQIRMIVLLVNTNLCCTYVNIINSMVSRDLGNCSAHLSLQTILKISYMVKITFIEQYYHLIWHLKMLSGSWTLNNRKNLKFHLTASYSHKVKALHSHNFTSQQQIHQGSDEWEASPPHLSLHLQSNSSSCYESISRY